MLARVARAARFGSLLGTLVGALAAGATGCGGDDGNGGPDGGSHGDGASQPDANLDGVTAVPLVSLGGFSYTAKMNFGAQSFASIIDTGSSSTGIAAATCTTCGVNPAYAPGANAIDKHKTAESHFGDGSTWTGEIFEDRAAIGPGPEVTLDFAAISSDGGFFMRGNGGTSEYAGIIGLGPDALLLPGTSSYVSAAVGDGLKGQIAFELCPDAGTMWLGGFDSSHAATAPVFTPLSTSPFFGAYYAVGVAGVSIDGTDTGITQAQMGPTIVDTGTSITFMPKTVINTLIAKISATSGYKAAFGTQALSDGGCVSTSMTAAQIDASLPKFAISFPKATGGTSEPIELPATQSYLVQQGGGFCFTISDAAQLFQGANASLIGDTMLTGLISVIDVTKKQVGFAAQTGCAAAHIAHTETTMPTETPWFRHAPGVRLPPQMR